MTLAASDPAPSKRKERKLLKLQRKLHIKQSKMGDEVAAQELRQTKFLDDTLEMQQFIRPLSSIHSPIYPSPDSSTVAGSCARLLETGTNYAADDSPGRQNS